MEGTIGVVREAERRLNQELPELARGVIQRHLDPSSPDTSAFLDRPDGREQHQTRWHQWGIITHTRVFLRHFETDIPALLRQWGLWGAANGILSARIDGAPRWDLLRLSILLHDIGKFGARKRGPYRFHFTDHERLSGTIIRQEIQLQRFGLTPAQVEYVAMTAEDHFVLGVVRKQSRDRAAYDEAFTRSSAFRDLALEIRARHPEDYVEIGVLFLGDSLAKADPATGPEPAVSQYEINLLVAHRYLEIVLESPPYNESTESTNMHGSAQSC